MYLFAAVFLPLVGICIAQNERCDSAGPRIDCGYQRISEGECTVDRGCCYNSSTEGIPWCFYKTTKCFPHNIRKVECGYTGITKEECVDNRKCCWYPIYTPKIPWCYKPGRIVACNEVTPTKRTDCGYTGISKAGCEYRKCCYDNTVRGVPFCFYNVEIED